MLLYAKKDIKSIKEVPMTQSTHQAQSKRDAAINQVSYSKEEASKLAKAAEFYAGERFAKTFFEFVS